MKYRWTRIRFRYTLILYVPRGSTFQYNITIRNHMSFSRLSTNVTLTVNSTGVTVLEMDYLPWLPRLELRHEICIGSATRLPIFSVG